MNQLEPTYDKKFECRMCKHAFTSKKVRSRFIKVSHYDTDFCPIYISQENSPILYHVHVCPQCGYSTSEDSTPYFPPGASNLLQAKVCNQWVPHEYGGKRTIAAAMNTFKLAIYCGTLKREKHITLAGLYLRLSWLYRNQNMIDQEQRFMKLAIQEYLDSYIEDDFRGSSVSETRLLYLVGELSRRTHNTEQAIKYFSKVIEQQSRTTEPKIIEMAREQWQEIRQNQKEKESIST